MERKNKKMLTMVTGVILGGVLMTGGKGQAEAIQEDVWTQLCTRGAGPTTESVFANQEGENVVCRGGGVMFAASPESSTIWLPCSPDVEKLENRDSDYFRKDCECEFPEENVSTTTVAVTRRPECN